MKLYYSLEDEAFIGGPGVRQKLSELNGLKRAMPLRLEVQFLDGENAEIPTTISASSFLDFGLKIDGEFDGDWLAHVGPDDWTQPNAGDPNPFYRATLNLNTTELNTAFSTPNADATDDEATVDTMTVFTAREPAFDDANHIADKLTCAVANSGNTGSEGVPVLASPGLASRVDDLEANALIVDPGTLALTSITPTQFVDNNLGADLSALFHNSGTVSFSGVTASFAGLGSTPLNAANLTGTLGAASGVNLTNLNASNLASGTVAAARLPANLTTLANNTSGTVTATNLQVDIGTVGVGLLGATINSGTGSPEGAVTAIRGSLFLRTDGGAGTCLYVKESGTGNTGWVAK